MKGCGKGWENQPDLRKVMHLQEKHVQDQQGTCNPPGRVRDNGILYFNEARAASTVAEHSDDSARSSAAQL